MKKTTVFIGFLILLMMLSACSSSKLADFYDEDAVINRAKEVVEVINTHDYDAINAELREDLQDKLTSENLKNAWDKTLTEAGDFKEYQSIVTVGQKSKSTGEDYATVVMICTYEKSTLTFTVTMDVDLEIVGMYLK